MDISLRDLMTWGQQLNEAYRLLEKMDRSAEDIGTARGRILFTIAQIEGMLAAHDIIIK